MVGSTGNQAKEDFVYALGINTWQWAQKSTADRSSSLPSNDNSYLS